VTSDRTVFTGVRVITHSDTAASGTGGVAWHGAVVELGPVSAFTVLLVF
jgi:hypothetical protein